MLIYLYTLILTSFCNFLNFKPKSESLPKLDCKLITVKNYFKLISIYSFLIFSCGPEENEELNCIGENNSLEICILNIWNLEENSDYFLFAKLPNTNDYFVINRIDNSNGDQMFYDYLTGTHERFFYPEMELLDYSIYEFVNNGFRHLYSTYEFNLQGEKIKFISITFNHNNIFYDVAVRINMENPSEIENQFRKIVVPSLKINGEKLFYLDMVPEKINQLNAEPLDSLLMK